MFPRFLPARQRYQSVATRCPSCDRHRGGFDGQNNVKRELAHAAAAAFCRVTSADAYRPVTNATSPFLFSALHFFVANVRYFFIFTNGAFSHRRAWQKRRSIERGRQDENKLISGTSAKFCPSEPPQCQSQEGNLAATLGYGRRARRKRRNMHARSCRGTRMRRSRHQG